MSIILYSMEGCGYCVKAKKMFHDEILSMKMVVEPSSNAPSEVNGFPTFSYNGTLHSGLPQTKQQLYDKLGNSKTPVKVIETFEPVKSVDQYCLSSQEVLLYIIGIFIVLLVLFRVLTRKH